MGINYQPQLVSLPDFWLPSTGPRPSKPLLAVAKLPSESAKVKSHHLDLSTFICARVKPQLNSLVLGDGKPPTWKMTGILISWGPINPYVIGLMSLSPYYMEIMGVDRPDRTCGIKQILGAVGPAVGIAVLFTICQRCLPLSSIKRKSPSWATSIGASLKGSPFSHSANAPWKKVWTLFSLLNM